MSLWRALSCHRHGSADRPVISIHDALTSLSDLDGLPDPLCCPVRLTADDSRLVPVDDVIICVDVIRGRDLFGSDCDYLVVLLVYLCPACMLFLIFLHLDSNTASRFSGLNFFDIFYM